MATLAAIIIVIQEITEVIICTVPFQSVICAIVLILLGSNFFLSQPNELEGDSLFLSKKGDNAAES